MLTFLATAILFLYLLVGVYFAYTISQVREVRKTGPEKYLALVVIALVWILIVAGADD